MNVSRTLPDSHLICGDAPDWCKSPLLPVVVQEYLTGELLMLAYANEEAFQLTVDTGFAHYFSRSRNKLWKKGDTSGHLQEIVEIRLDCDSDSILYVVKQTGVACHTGAKSCFFKLIHKRELTDGK